MANAVHFDTDLTFEEALERVPEVLKPEGFGILTQIDVTGTFKKKLDMDFRRYTIMGACNPKLASQALSQVLEIGVYMPCNVIVYETDDGKAHIAHVNPMTTFGALKSAPEGFQQLAETVKEKLTRALSQLAKK